jgi:hypothetical protein
MLFKDSVRTSKRTPHFTITKINWLTVFKEIIAVRFQVLTAASMKFSVMEAVRTSETSFNFNVTTQRNIPKTLNFEIIAVYNVSHI